MGQVWSISFDNATKIQSLMATNFGYEFAHDGVDGVRLQWLRET